MFKVGVGCTFLLCLAALGCGNSGKMKVYKVHGKVILNGQPVEDVSVAFSPINGKRAATGRTDAQGVYNLTTYDTGDGAPEGEYKVLVTKSAPPAQAPATPTHDPTGKTSGSPAHTPGKTSAKKSNVIIPEKFSKESTTTIKRTVTAGDNDIDIDLDLEK